MENQDTSNQEWWTPSVRYDPAKGYVMLQLPEVKLPLLSYSGTSFIAKDELHCSLLCIPKVAAGLSQDETDCIKNIAQAYVQQAGVTLEGFSKQLYLCQDGDARTIVVAARVSGLEGLFTALRQSFAQLRSLPEPAAHVTLYRFNHPFGIGIQNEDELNHLCRPIPETDLTEIREVVHDQV